MEDEGKERRGVLSKSDSRAHMKNMRRKKSRAALARASSLPLGVTEQEAHELANENKAMRKEIKSKDVDKHIIWESHKKVQSQSENDITVNYVSFLDLSEGKYRLKVTKDHNHSGHAVLKLYFQDKDGKVILKENHGALGRFYHAKHQQFFQVDKKNEPVELRFALFGSTGHEMDCRHGPSGLPVFDFKLQKFSDEVSHKLHESPMVLHTNPWSIAAATKETLISSIQKINLPPLSNEVEHTFSGPKLDEDGKEHEFETIASAVTVSTYPQRNKTVKEGDPICDQYMFAKYATHLVWVLADGCSWGEKPRLAAQISCKTFNAHVASVLPNMHTLKHVASFLLEALEICHARIIEGYQEDLWQAGTTTVAGSLLLPMEGGQWILLTANVGDCKVFVYSHKKKTVKDITAGNRGNLTDPKDPGGRIGPYVGNGLPDWRNLGLYSAICSENDVIFTVSDGVHDNFDAQEIGFLPSEVGVKKYKNWEEAAAEEPMLVERKKNEFREQKIQNMIEALVKTSGDGILHPSALTKALTRYSLDTTKKSRHFMENNSGMKLPHDFKEYPGKLDHTTCVAVRVSSHWTH